MSFLACRLAAPHSKCRAKADGRPQRSQRRLTFQIDLLLERAKIGQVAKKSAGNWVLLLLEQRVDLSNDFQYLNAVALAGSLAVFERRNAIWAQAVGVRCGWLLDPGRSFIHSLRGRNNLVPESFNAGENFRCRTLGSVKY